MTLLAKSIENGGTLLVDHLRHTAIAIKKIAEGIELGEEEGRIAILAAYLHDIGKAHPIFQAKLQHGLHERPAEIPLRHEISSLLFLPLTKREYWNVIIEYIIAHHKAIGLPDSDAFGDKGLNYLCNHNKPDDVFDLHAGHWDEWSPAAIEILGQCGVAVRQITYDDAREAFDTALEYCDYIIRYKVQSWSKRRGVMMAADHLASALADDIERHTERLFLKPNLQYFDRKSNLFPLSEISTNDSRQHTLVKAPTGAGKTDFLLRRCKGRIFYTLPYQASINAMGDRLKTSVDNCYVRLLHASSKFLESNREERALQGLAGAGIKVLTPHQLGALATGTFGFESIAVDIAGCDVILDEIHCYREAAQAITLEIVRALLRLDCRIHIGTATMPTALERQLKSLLGGEKSIYSVELPPEKLATYDRHHIFKIQSFDDALCILDKFFGESIPKTEVKCLVVCNRVDVAQQRFGVLQNHFPRVRSMLIHSRFKRSDRAEKERELKDIFNSSGPCIIVATQVVEVSLDISADMMITDCAPLDSLIQRFGRVNRRRSAESDASTTKPIYVIAPPKEYNAARPYEPAILAASFGELPDNDTLHEKDLQCKLDAVYPEINIPQKDIHFVWKGDRFSMYKLCHYPKSVLMEILNIESQTLIMQSDVEKYRKAKAEERTAMEIPILRNVLFKKFTQFGREQCGSHPVVAHDDLYCKSFGLRFAEIDNFI